MYCSEPFEALTGYSSSEILGKNCRFLQQPHPSSANIVTGYKEADSLNEKTRAKLRDKIKAGEEAQVRLINYTKGGVRFFNILTVIPIMWEEDDARKRYVVGFQAQDNSRFR